MMSDEALNAHLQWLDDCARAQVVDYETWLEGRVAQLEAENRAATTHIREIIETTNAQRTEIEELLADLAEAREENSALKRESGRIQTIVNGAIAGLDREKYPAFGQLLDALLTAEEQPC